jgi:hypothetical protein
MHKTHNEIKKLYLDAAYFHLRNNGFTAKKAEITVKKLFKLI